MFTKVYVYNFIIEYEFEGNLMSYFKITIQYFY